MLTDWALQGKERKFRARYFVFAATNVLLPYHNTHDLSFWHWYNPQPINWSEAYVWRIKGFEKSG